MKIVHLLLAVSIGFVFTACSSSKESTGVWVNKEKMQGKSFSKVFIVVMTADIQARVNIEKDLAAAAEAKGYKVVKSIDAIPVSLDKPKLPTKDEILGKIKESGCDAIFIASLLNKEEAVHYTPGTTAYTVMPYYTYYGTFTGFYTNYYQNVSTSSYYSKDKVYFMQSNLYDAASEEIMWSVQSKVFNPSSISRFSKSYTTSLVMQLEKEHFMKK